MVRTFSGFVDAAGVVGVSLLCSLFAARPEPKFTATPEPKATSAHTKKIRAE
jgi:hypothetical protein